MNGEQVRVLAHTDGANFEAQADNDVAIASGRAIDIALISGFLFCLLGHVAWWLVFDNADLFSATAIWAYPFGMFLALVLRILLGTCAHKNERRGYRLYGHQKTLGKLLFWLLMLCSFCGGMLFSDVAYYLVLWLLEVVYA